MALSLSSEKKILSIQENYGNNKKGFKKEIKFVFYRQKEGVFYLMKKFRRGTAFFLAVLVLLSTFLQVCPAKAAEVDDNLKTVKIEQPENGRIYFSDCTDDISEKMFMLNSTCEFVVEPNEGYTLDGLVINYGDLQGSAANNINENVWSVNVNTDLTISATFKKAENTENNISETDVEDTEEIGEPETTEELEQPVNDEDVELATLSDDGNVDVLSSARGAAPSTFKNLGSVTYGGSKVGHFTIDDKIAFCIEHSKKSPPNGTTFWSEIYSNDTIKKCLYYGWQGQKQWGGFSSEAQGIVVTSLALSHFYSGEPANVTPLISDFVNYINSQPVPDNNVSFSPNEVEATLQSDGTQRTSDITLNGSSDNSVTFTLQSGVTLVKKDGTEMSGTVTVSGGTTFYLRAPLTVNDAFETGTLSGSLGEYNSVVYDSSKTNYQKVIQGGIYASDPQHATNLKVNWLKAGNLTINKTNGYGELVSGAKFRVQSVSPGVNYDETVTVENGTLTITGLLIGNYEVTELSTPDNNGSASGTGYLLDVNNTQTIEITAGNTTTLNVENTEPRGQITLTKYDSEYGTQAQGLATLQGAAYQLYAKDNIVNANGTVLYQSGSAVQSPLYTDANGQITWSDLPMGTYYAKELVPSTGYKLDETEHIVTLAYADQQTQIITNTTSSNEEIIRGRMRIYKYDNKTGELLTAYPTKFNVYTVEGMYINGNYFPANSLVETIATVNGVATTSYLPYGRYYITEAEAPVGYLGNAYRTFFNIEMNGMVVQNELNGILNYFSYINDDAYTNYYDNPVTGVINLQKLDSETNKNTPQGAATLVGANYSIYAAEDILDPANGSVLFKKGTIISQKNIGTGMWGDIGTKATDNNAQIQWQNLPTGTYNIKETSPSTGYNLSSKVYTVTLKYRDANTPTVSVSTNVTEDVIRGDIEISKFGRNSNDDETTEMNPLAGVIFSLTAKTTGETWYFETNENGYFDSSVSAVYRKITKANDGSIALDKSSALKRNSRGFFVYDTYTLREISTPKGYVPINDLTFNLKKQSYKYQWILEDKDIVSALRVVKTDAETGNTIPMAGVTFRIYDSKMNPITMCVSHYPSTQYADKFTTDETGTFTFPQKLQVGTYYLEEISAPDGYLLGGLMQFTIEEGRSWESPLEIAYSNENVKGKIKIQKTDSLSGEVVEGAEYGIYAREDIITNDGTVRNHAGELVDTVTTDKKGKAVSKELYLGKYYVVETTSPDEYKLNDKEYDVELVYEDAETPIVYTSVETEDEPNTIYILKKDKVTKDVLTGATLQLINEDGKVMDEWVSDEEPHKITKLPKGTYTLHEKEAPDGYNVADDIDIDLKGGIETEVIEMEDAPIQTEFEKFDSLDDENSLPGATYQLINDEGSVVDEWVTDGEAHQIYAPKAGTYTVHEVEAPEGYDIEKDYDIEIVESEKTQEFQMKDNPIRARISKLDKESGKPLKGATLQLINNNDEVVDEWVSDEEPHEVYAIPTGTYTLHEKEAPEGYALAEDMEIEIEQTDEVQNFTMKDPQIHVAIEKLNHDTKKQLAGATLQIIDKDGNVVEEWVTEEKAHEIYKLPVGTYTLHEEKAPEGFKVADDMKIEVVQTDKVQKFTMEDKVIGGIKANMNTDGRILEGGLLGKIRAAVKTSDGVNVFNIALGIIGALLFFAVAGIRTAYRKRKDERKETVKKKKLGLLAVLLFSLFIVSTEDVQAATKDTVTDTKEYTTTNKDETGIEFAQTLKKDGKSYKLGSVGYKILDKTPVKEKQEVTKTVESDLVKKTDEYTPDESITEDGIDFFLKDCTVIDGSEYTQDFTKSYDYLETDVSIPNNQVFTGTDENGNTVEINGKLAKQETLSDGEWLNTDVTIQFDHYDTGVFEWQGGAIENNSANPLEGHYDELLQAVGADTTNYRVLSTEWSGDAYESDGIVYRNAVAHVQYFVHYVRATYSGAIEYVKYESTYQGTQEVDSADKYSYKIRATATYERVRALTTTQIIIFTTIGIAVLAALVVLVLHVIAKKKEQKKSKEKKQIGKFAIKGGKLC